MKWKLILENQKYEESIKERLIKSCFRKLTARERRANQVRGKYHHEGFSMHQGGKKKDKAALI